MWISYKLEVWGTLTLTLTLALFLFQHPQSRCLIRQPSLEVTVFIFSPW
jgi:hypothetical protein